MHHSKETKINLTRRDVLRSSAAAASAALWFPIKKTLAEESVSKNDRPTFALIGTGGRGQPLARDEMLPYADLVALCDVNISRAEGFAQQLQDDKLVQHVDVLQDYRRLLDRKDIDLLVCATPDHWHGKITVDACRAGKDIYTEKPFSLTIDEGKKVCQVVEETGCVVQIGTMQRSEKPFQAAVELVRNGRIGKLKQVWVALPWYSMTGGPFSIDPIPHGFDWEIYQGPAPEHEFVGARASWNYRWFYDYAGGMPTEWGQHHIDIAHWGMDCDQTGPVQINARARFPNEGIEGECYDTPDHFFSRMLYPNDVEVLFFTAGKDVRSQQEEDGHLTSAEQDWLFGNDTPEEIRQYDRNGVMFIGEKGKLFVNRGDVHGKAVDELAENPLPDDAWRVRPSDDHAANFVECAKSRETPVAPAAVEHRTATACHLTNISLRLGRPIEWDPVKEEIVGDSGATAMLARVARKPYQIDV